MGMDVEKLNEKEKEKGNEKGNENENGAVIWIDLGLERLGKL